jgi:hypothetical protein
MAALAYRDADDHVLAADVTLLQAGLWCSRAPDT